MILITLINLLKMFRYNYILLLCLIVSSSIDGAIEIRNSRKLDPTLFQSIIYEEITINKLSPAAAKEIAIRIIRLSILSDR